MRNGAWFPYFLIALLLVSVGSNVYLVVRANSDPAFSVEPNYYQKAVDWDKLQAKQAKSEALGWSSQLNLSSEGIELILRDRFGRTIADADVFVEAYHNARANQRIKEVLTPTHRGAYTLERTFTRKGIWEIHIDAKRDDDHYLALMRQELL